MLDWAHNGFLPKGQEGLKPRENAGEHTSYDFLLELKPDPL